MALSMDPFEGAKSEGQEQRRGLLDVIAQSGAAGRKAYEDAQTQATNMRKGAIDWAGQRAAITGNNFGGADLAPVTEAADRYGTYFAGQNAAHQANLGQIGASADSYLAKVNAIAPFIQSQNLNKAYDRENALKAAIAQNQAKIDADKAAAERGYAHEIDMLNRRAGIDAAASARSSGGGGVDASKVTLDQLLGAATQTIGRNPGLEDSQGGRILGGPRMSIGSNDVSHLQPLRFTLSDEALKLGNIIGVPATTLAGLYSPSKQSSLHSNYENLAPAQKKLEKDSVASAWATKYDTKGVTPALAQSVVNNKDFQKDVNWILNGAEGASREEAESLLRKYYVTDRGWNSEFVILAGEYLPMLPTQKEIDEATVG